MNLKKSDLRLLAETYAANIKFQMPYCPGHPDWERALALTEAGLLRAHNLKFVPPVAGMDGYSMPIRLSPMTTTGSTT